MAMNEVVVDTSALVEYTFATAKGKIVKGILEDEDNIIIVPSIVIGELVSKLERSGVKNAQELMSYLAEYIITAPIEWHCCFKAGKRHAELRKIEKSISLIDCIVMQIAEEHGDALILTSDLHFRHYKNVKLV